jgi:hypothetical protein
MGHLLASVNPDAAAAIDNPPAPPDIGTWVVMKGRAGFSRMHRTEFPALVLGHHPEDGSLTLMVVMEPEDMMMETRVPFQSHNQEYFCWRYRRGEDAADVAERIGAVEEFLRGEDKLGEIVEAIGKRLEAVESVLASDEIEQIEKGMWGDHDKSKVSVPSLYDQIEMLNKSLDSLSKRMDDLANATLPDGEVRTSRTKKG